MDPAFRRVQEAARDASSGDDLVRDVFDVPFGEGQEEAHPLDRETLDEQASTQMGAMWEQTRRDADD